MRSLNATVDGVAVSLPAPATVLDACSAAGAAVVALCFHPSLTSAPSCNTCQVIVNGIVLRACAEPLRPEAEINTVGAAAVNARRQSLSKASMGHPVACSTCHQSGACELQDGLVTNAPVFVEPSSGRTLTLPTASNALGLIITLHKDLCVGCTRCVRFADEVLHTPSLSLHPSYGRVANLQIDEGAQFNVSYTLALTEVCPVGVFEHNEHRPGALALWNQAFVPSVCAGCATGCPVWLHGNEAGVRRVSSRGGAHHLCNDGYEFFGKRRVSRLAVPSTANAVASWDRALAASAALLAPALHKGSLAVVFSAQSPTLDLAALSSFAVERAATPHMYTYHRTNGDATPPLMNADKNPNAASLKLLAPKARPLESLVDDIAQGKVAAVIFVGVEAVTPENHPTLFAALGGLSALVVASSFDDELTRHAMVSLPLSTFEETAGSFVNAGGVAQPFAPFHSPTGDALPGWDLMNHLSRLLGIDIGFESLNDARVWLKRHHPTLCPIQGEP